MIQYRDFIYYEGTNNPVVNAEVSVYIGNTTTLATLYTDGTGATQKANPVTSDQTGMFEFYAAAGLYDIYYLGVKQYQIAINEAIGLPDPLNVQTVNCTTLWVSGQVALSWSNAPDARTMIGNTADDGINKLQVEGQQIIRAVGFTVPIAQTIQTSLKVMGNSNATSCITVQNFADTGGNGGVIRLLRNFLDGSFPLLDQMLGRVTFGTTNPDGSTNYNSAMIDAFSAENMSATGTGSYMRFLTTPIAATAPLERMRLMSSGELSIGSGANLSTTVMPALLQLQSAANAIGGLLINSATSFAFPLAVPYSVPNSPIRIIGNSVNTSTARASMFNDTSTASHGFTCMKNALNGAMALTDWSLGAFRFGSTNPTTGADKTVSFIEGYAAEDLTDTTCGGGMRFYSTPVTTATALERMRLTAAGSVLVATPTTLIPETAFQSKLQVFGGVFAQDAAAPPWFATNGPGLGQICVYGATANRGSFSCTVVNDTAGQAGGIYCFRLRSGGAWPQADDRLGTLGGGTLRSTGGSFNPVSIGFFADDTWVDGVTNGASIRFFTIKSNSTETQQERMRISNPGNLLIGRTTDTGAKLSITMVTGTSGGIHVTESTVTSGFPTTGVGMPAALLTGANYNSSTYASELLIDSNATGPRVMFLKRTAAGLIPQAAGSRLGMIQFGSYDAAANTTPAGAIIDAYSDGLWDAGTNTPGYVTIKTTPAGSNVGAERMRVTSSGKLWVGTTVADLAGIGYGVEFVGNGLSNSGSVKIAPASGGTTGLLDIYADNDTTNAACLRLLNQSGSLQIISRINGAGTLKRIDVGMGAAILMTFKTNNRINMSSTAIPVYANNAAAITGGLVAGDLYRTGADPDPLCIVH